ncbi:MAG: carbon-nitrogen family hydrolase [Gemmatimonadaceae bacterium]|nr:carbon-nitrogen family hydrolase [Gemmatimonadaceae bacterium]
MRIALASMDQAWENKELNLERVSALANSAAGLGAELVVFPEMTLTGFTMNTGYSAETAENSPSVKALAQIAAAEKIWLLAGVVFRSGETATNNLVGFAPDGMQRVLYAKIHPFSFAGEDRFFSRGEHLATLALTEFTLGLSICYDLRFPELFAALADKADVLINIANWPRRRLDHWVTLLRARAIENQVYVVGVNRTGTDGNGVEYVSSSMVIDPNGVALSPVSTAGDIDVYDMTRQALDEFRKSFSTRQDRLPDLYGKFLHE